MLPENPRFQPRISTNQTFPPPRIIPDNFPSDSGPKPIPLQYRSRSKHQSLETQSPDAQTRHPWRGKKKKKKKSLEKRKKKTSQKQFLGKIPLPADMEGGRAPLNYPCSRGYPGRKNFRSVTWPTLTLLCVPFATRAGGGGRKEGRKTIGRGGWKVKPGL